MNDFTFNIRVYGLLISDSKLLIAEQFYKNRLLRKFPGGGVDYGEGLIDALKREFIEELNLEIEVIGHYYTTDFFVQSIFQERDQVISVYYKVKPSNGSAYPLPEYSGLPVKDGEEFFRWIKLKDIANEEFFLPIESKVAEMLYEDYLNIASK